MGNQTPTIEPITDPGYHGSGVGWAQNDPIQKWVPEPNPFEQPDNPPFQPIVRPKPPPGLFDTPSLSDVWKGVKNNLTPDFLKPPTGPLTPLRYSYGKFGW